MAKPFTLQWVTLGNGRLTLLHYPGHHAFSQLRQQGCDRIVTLLVAEQGGLAFGEAAQQSGMLWTWLPIKNGKWPPDEVAAAILAELPRISAQLDAGESILIHCNAGIHRTGMVAYALLRLRGYPEEAALALIHQMRPHTRAGIQPRQIDWGNRMIPLSAEAPTPAGSASSVEPPQ